MKKKSGRRLDTSRDHDMCCLYRSGETLEEVGLHYGVCRERARQILARNGLTRKDGGGSVKAKESRKEATEILAKSRAKRMKKFGISWEEYESIRCRVDPSVMVNFLNTKSGSINGERGYKKTSFELTLAEYVDIWESAGFEANQKGYKFARHDPKNGFIKGNVGIFSDFEMGRRAGNEHGFVAHPENILVNKRKVASND